MVIAVTRISQALKELRATRLVYRSSPMTRGMGRGHSWLVLTCCAAALTAASCSSGARTSIQTSTVLTESAAATANSQTAKITTTLTGAGGPPTSEQMVYDFIHRRGEVMPWSDPDGSSGSEVIIDGSTFFEDVATVASGAQVDLHGKKWLKIAAPNNAQNPLANAFSVSPSAGMATLITKLAPLVSAIHQDGTASIGGVTTTKYILTVSMGKWRSLVGATAADPRPSGPLMLWTDAQDRVRQVQLSYSIPHFGKMTMKTDYTNFGIPVHVSVPPASEVMTEQQYESDICAAAASSGSATGQATLFANGTSSPPQNCSSIGTTTP